MPDHDEHQLFWMAKEGDRGAFDRLQERLEPAVRHFVRRLIGSSDEEDEIAQNAFLALYMNLERIDPVEHLRPFVFRVVRNLCYDELRSKNRFQYVSLEGQPDDLGVPLIHAVDPRPEPDDLAHWGLLYSQVQRTMEYLPEPQRQALILRFEEDFSYAQIAEATGTDIGTVKSRIHYGRKHLVRLLRPEILTALGIEDDSRDDED